MSIYLVQRDLSGITEDKLAQAQQAAIQTAADLTSQGKSIEYIRSTFLPETSACMCLFRSEEEDYVRELNEKAGLPFDRIVTALELSP